LKGIIVKALSGFYYVRTAEGLITCRARGLFRKTGESPLVGDRVTIALSGAEGTVETIAPRRNAFVRPSVANVDAVVIFASAAIPVTDPFLIDRMTVIAARQGVSSVLCVNKTDLDPAEGLIGIYRRAGIPVVATSARTGAGLDALREAIRGKTVVFTGNSGVGKSAILRGLSPEAAVQTGEVSQKLGRGRHTTRHVELYALGDETYVADTPGFSSFDTEELNLQLRDHLPETFPEFAPYVDGCRFQCCRHVKEKGCAVLDAVRQGRIPAERHRSYVRLWDELKDLREWNT
jgi:ribosome biogenesis GTPase